MQKLSKLKNIPRNKHIISRSNISPFALKVLYRLKDAGFAAYLVGGGVRDLLLGKTPKDFDIATEARPEQIKQLFRNCILIGRRFRLAHIKFGRDIIEVATFRGEHHQSTHQEEAKSVNGMLIRDNVYGSMEEDAWRRDFTINALYYSIADFSVIDYCGGMADLKKGVIRIIGDPSQRYQEDPVRLLRAIRFAGKLNFEIAKETAEPLSKMGSLLSQVSPARLFEEILKLFLTGCAAPVFDLLEQHGLFKQLFPSTDVCLNHNAQYPAAKFLKIAMQNSDKRLHEGKTITPVFLLAALLWYPLLTKMELEVKTSFSELAALDTAIRQTLKDQSQLTTIPKRLAAGMQDIWHLQFRFRKRQKRYISKALSHPRFRAAYDFLLLRAEAGEDVVELAKWWTDYYEGNEQTRQSMLKQLQPKRIKKSRNKQ